MALAAKELSSAMTVACLLALSTPAQAQSSGMTFFVTSVGVGNGANLGGLAGADTHCQRLAQGAGAGGNAWHAYLSTQAADGQSAVNARDRIGKGPWQNAKGVVIAKDIADLHSPNNNLTKQTAHVGFGQSRRSDRPPTTFPVHPNEQTSSVSVGMSQGPKTDLPC